MIKTKLWIYILCVFFIVSCNNINKNINSQNDIANKGISTDSVNNKIQEVVITEYQCHKIDTLLESKWECAYDIYKDTLFYIGSSNRLIKMEQKEKNQLFELPLEYAAIRLFVFKNYFATGTGYMLIDSLYLFNRNTLELIDTLPNFNILSRIDNEKCLFHANIYDKTTNIPMRHYCIFDVNTMDTIYSFPNNINASYFSGNYYTNDITNSLNVIVLNSTFVKCGEFLKDGYYKYFGNFSGNYFGYNKEKLHFYNDENNASDIIFESPLNNPIARISNKKLHIYGWSYDGTLHRLIRYEITKTKT